MLRRGLFQRFKSVAVCGSGNMGSGIALVTANAGIPVTVSGISQDCLESSRAAIDKYLRILAKKQMAGKSPEEVQSYVDQTLSRITFTTDIHLAASANLIVEAIVENLDEKKKLFKQLDELSPKDTVFCSNTSSLSVSEMASVTSRPDRFAGLHFFSPVALMQLVEVVKTEETSPKVIESLMEHSKRIGKVPVLAKDTEGFIANRLLTPYIMEAIRLYERGVASMEDTDVSMRLGCGHPMGPFELADAIGLDIVLSIITGWHHLQPTNALFEPPKTLIDLVHAGKLGKKSREGFFKYNEQGKRVR